ncbi:MAG: DNA gyrase subunit A [Nanoarchaeota archaeon]|nr:DNA gyrase subunit A [Nanoarchaeota archaeon]
MKTAYLDYAMSVIIGRALPDVRDGLKPVHRRILFAMNEMGLTSNKPFKKSARIVGEVLGKYHPHGDTAVYDSLVRMAQEFSLRYPLVKGQGNFGSVDGDNAAAMRYTEAKMAKISNALLADIEKETVDTRPNFDDSLEEPTVLPTKLPHLLINGSNGIAVGMATNIPPHNLNEIVDATIALIDQPDIEVLDLTQYVQGPDFPTGAQILGKNGILNAFKQGRGKIKIRSVIKEEEIKGRPALIVTEIPYQVNKAMLLEQIAEGVRDKKIEGISGIRDESDRKGMRIVIELKRDASIDVVKNQLFKHSRLQTTMGIIFLSIVDGQPKVLGLKEILEEFIKHRKEVVTRRTAYDLGKAEKKAHLLEGLTKALDHIDAVIALIKKASSAQTAKEELIAQYDFSDEQSQAILDMKLQKLTNLEQGKIREDYDQTLALIADLKDILAHEERVRQIIKDELIEMKDTYGDQRRTTILDVEDEDIDDEDLIPEEEQVVTITKSGYIKRLSTDTYRLQNRGGKGVIGTSMKEEDIVEHLFVASTHSYLLIFTTKGQVHWLKVYKVPEGSRQAKGKAIINLINIEQDEQVASVIPVREFDEHQYLLMATKKGIIKKTGLDAYSRPRQTGIIGITLDEGDQVMSVVRTDGKQNILLATKQGQAIRFKEQDARPIGRTSRGVRGITLSKNDEVIGMAIVKDEQTVFTVTENGYGKRSPVIDYRLINRGGKGVRNIICSERNGSVVSMKAVNGDEEILLISKQGIVIRTGISQISSIGRNTQGLRIMRLTTEDAVKTAALIHPDDEEPEQMDESTSA